MSPASPAMTETTEPRTEAGRGLLDDELRPLAPEPPHFVGLREGILAIEAEATHLALEEVAERVRALPLRSFVMEGPDDDDREWLVTKTAVLALLTSPSPTTKEPR